MIGQRTLVGRQGGVGMVVALQFPAKADLVGGADRPPGQRVRRGEEPFRCQIPAPGAERIAHRLLGAAGVERHVRPAPDIPFGPCLGQPVEEERHRDAGHEAAEMRSVRYVGAPRRQNERQNVLEHGNRKIHTRTRLRGNHRK